MNNIFSIIKDIIIAAIIAVLTSGLFEVSNILYQSIITILILIIIFLVLRRIDKNAKRLEILSILYVEQFLAPLVKAIEGRNEDKIKGYTINKIKVFIILPTKVSEVYDIVSEIRFLDRFEIDNPDGSLRTYLMYGKVIGSNQLVLFDTPGTWMASLNYLTEVKGMNERKINHLLTKMIEDIKSYAQSTSKDGSFNGVLNFMSLDEFKSFY